jgi:ribulose 1,5-bisphosphate synthetase/thiazole synthase
MFHVCYNAQRRALTKAPTSRRTRVTQNDVLIIGAGPSGLFAAAELARYGIAARPIAALDRHLGSYLIPETK